MKVSRLTEKGWKRIHSGSVLGHFTLSSAEIRAPFMLIWWKIEANTEMTIDKGHPEGEVFVIISGTGTLTVGEEEREVKEGETIYVPPRVPHWVNNDSDEEIIGICIKYQERSRA